MTFRQWSAANRVSRFSSAFLVSLEAVWNELIRAGKKEGEVAHLLDDLMDGIQRRHD